MKNCKKQEGMIGMRIAVDIFGGDNAPLEPLKACIRATKEGIAGIIAVGDEGRIRSAAEKEGLDLTGIEILHAPSVIPVEANPTDITKKYGDSSMAVTLRAVAEGKADAAISAGSTGAFVVGATLIVKRIKGVRRAAFAPVIPSGKGAFMMLDVGANVDCRPEMLVQFALLGSIYMEKVMGVRSPTVGLVNIGTEETKGQELQIEAHRLLKDAPVNFIGNVEPRYLPGGACDVAVADGFTGNIVLKTMEGTIGALFGEIKKVLYSSAMTKLAALMLKKGLVGLKRKMDYAEYGGTALLGISKPIVKVHGDSRAKTYVSAMRQAVRMYELNVVGLMSEAVSAQRMKEEE